VLQTLLLCLIAWGVWDKKCSVRVECREEKA